MTGGGCALDCARKPGFDPVAGQDEARHRCLDARPGRLAGRERERRVLFANDGAALQYRVARAGNGAGDLARGKRDECRVVGPHEGVGPAGHQRQVRRRLAEHPPLVEDPLHLPPGQSHEQVVHHRAVVPEIHGHDRLGGHPRGARDDPGHRRGFPDQEGLEREPGDGGDDLRDRHGLAAHFHPGDPSGIDPDAREGIQAHLAALGLEVPPRGERVHLMQRLERQHQRRIGAGRAEHLGQHLHERLRRRLTRRLVQGRDGQRLPQPLAQASSLSVPREPLVDGFIPPEGGNYRVCGGPAFARIRPPLS